MKKNVIENISILSISALGVCLILWMLFMQSSAPKGLTYEVLSHHAKSECVLSEKLEAQGVHTAYVYPHSVVSDVWEWYQRTRKECGIA